MSDPAAENAPMDLSLIDHLEIHPALGVARVGNSQLDPRLAPEVPGQRPPLGERFKDESGRILRQAARFRIYAYNAAGEVLGEITADVARVEWRVHVANRKGAWYRFENAMDLGQLAKPASKRNASYAGPRTDLVIDPGPRVIEGRDVHGSAYQLDTGRFAGRAVSLGELRTDDAGRLLFTPGLGRSASIEGSKPSTFANNDGWHDDIADGTVRATVRLPDGAAFEAAPALVASAPPNYGQGLSGVVTMFDVLRDLFVREGSIENGGEVRFFRDVYPILERLSRLGWANAGFDVLFGPGAPYHFADPAVIAPLSDPSEEAAPARRRLFAWFRVPSAAREDETAIPPVYGDAFGDYDGVPGTGLAVTATQYAALERWAAGDFVVDTPDAPAGALDELALAERPEALTRAHLEDCLGGPFHPGIELTWVLRLPHVWTSPFRPRVLAEGDLVRMDWGAELQPATAVDAAGPFAAFGPGMLTMWLGVPWQTDEASCMAGYERGTYLPAPTYWAARVPNHVLPERALRAMEDAASSELQRHKHLGNRPAWLRYFSTQYLARIHAMVEEWDRVGILREREPPAALELPANLWVEGEVWSGFTEEDPTWEQVEIAEGREDPAAPAPAGLAAPVPPARARTHGRRKLGRDEH